MERNNMGTIRLHCPRTDSDEIQLVIKESEDGITLQCNGCGKIHSHEIGELADLFNPLNESLVCNKSETTK